MLTRKEVKCNLAVRATRLDSAQQSSLNKGAMGFHAISKGTWASTGPQAREHIQVKLPDIEIQVAFPSFPPHLTVRCARIKDTVTPHLLWDYCNRHIICHAICT